MTRPELVEVMAWLGAAYRRQIADDELAVWWNVVGGFDPSEAMAAARWFATSEEQMPTPARFRQRVLSERKALGARDAEDRGLAEDTTDLTPPEVALPRLREIRETLMAKQRVP